MSAYIFLDVDGVLNSKSTTARSPRGFVFVDDEKVQLVKSIVDTTGAQLILSSDWRFEWNREDESYNGDDFNALRALFQKNGMDFIDHTGEYHFNWTRGRELFSYLRAHPNISNYIIIDDDISILHNPCMVAHAILTDTSVGLTEIDAAAAINLLNEGSH